MENTIVGKGLFVFTLSGLASGDEIFLSRYGSYESIQIHMGIQGLMQIFTVLRETNVAKPNKKRWFGVRHPDLGYLQWKQGIDFRSAKPYLIIRLNGRLILEWWPNTPWGQRWKAPKGALMSDQNHVESVLANAAYTYFPTE